MVGNTHRLLEFFERHHVHGTFFILGWVAERFPSLVRDIAVARPRGGVARLPSSTDLHADAAISSATMCGARRR